MNYQHSILPLFSAFVFLGLGAIFFSLGKGKTRIKFLRFFYATFHWQFSWFFLFFLNTPKYADIIVRIGYSGIIFLPVTFYDSILEYLKIKTKTIPFLYGLSILFLVLLWSGDLFIEGYHKYYFGYYPKANQLFHPIYLAMVIYIAINMCASLWSNLNRYKTTFQKNQMRLLLIAIITFCLASIDYALNYPHILDFYNISLYPMGVFFIISSVLVVILAHFITLNFRLTELNTSLEKRVEQKAAQLKEKEKQKTELLSNITHELKTPLSIIMGHSELLLGEVGSTNDFLLSPLKQIQQSAVRLGNHVDRIIKFSMLDNCEEKLKLDIYEYASLVQNIFILFEEKSKDENIKYVLNTTDSKPIVQVDIVKIEEILINLIQNAFKFTTPGGKISISIYNTYMNVITEVSDTGKGIDADKQEYVFDRMYQAEDVLSKQHGGIGIGLSICKKNAEAHGGRIIVSSKKNEGTIFRLILPLYIDQDAVVKNQEYEGIERRKSNRDRRYSSRRKRYEYKESLFLEDCAQYSSDFNVETSENKNPDKPSILVVEDIAEMMGVVVDALKEDYNLFLAKNAFVAIDKLNKNEDKISLILCDIMMPGMSGFDFCKEIMTREECRHIPLIFVTALISEEKQIEGYELGATDYIVKPYNIKILKEKVSHWISRRNYELLLKNMSVSLESKVQVISRLKDIILHEVRNPLQILGGANYFLQKLKVRFYDQSSGTEKRWWHHVDKINKGVEYLNSTLETSKHIEGTSLGRKKPEFLRDIFNDAVQYTTHLVGEIDFSIDMDQNTSMQKIFCDKKILTQVFVNIIRNAVEAIKENGDAINGYIRIECGIDNHETVKISFIDNGIGIPYEAKKSIFNFKFTTKKDGTGIGLHFSKMILKLHGGSINVSSKENEGTAFLLTLPLIKKT